MRDNPVYLNLFRIKFPITAIVSFLHRVSGVVLFLLIPVFLKILQNSLYSAESFDKYCNVIIGSLAIKFVVWFCLLALVYHLLAGIRHLFMDAGYGEDKKTATISSYAIFLGMAIFSIILGLRLC